MTEKTKNRIFWGILIAMILYAVTATYIRVFIKMDYLMMNEVSCDPFTESCYVYSAEETCEESDDPNCILNTEDWVYKIIYKKAANIPFCEYNPDIGESCPELTCEPGEPENECYFEYCEGEDCLNIEEEIVEVSDENV
jgi:hypothetical protein